MVLQEADLVRLQSGLQYKSETKITEAVNRLQHQLRTQNFRLNEEKKIVAEIDTLKRSRKDLGCVVSLNAFWREAAVYFVGRDEFLERLVQDIDGVTSR